MPLRRPIDTSPVARTCQCKSSEGFNCPKWTSGSRAAAGFLFFSRVCNLVAKLGHGEVAALDKDICHPPWLKCDNVHLQGGFICQNRSSGSRRADGNRPIYKFCDSAAELGLWTGHSFKLSKGFPPPGLTYCNIFMEELSNWPFLRSGNRKGLLGDNMLCNRFRYMQLGDIQI